MKQKLPRWTITSPSAGPWPGALNFLSSLTVHGSFGDTPRSEETLPKANPDSLEPAGPSSPASVTVTVGDEGADTPVGATPLIGDEPENLEGDGDLQGGRVLLGERRWRLGRGGAPSDSASSDLTLLPVCCFPGHATKSFPSSPSKGGACPSRAKMSMTGAGKSPPSVQSLAMRLLSMPGAQGAAAGPEPPPATTSPEGQPKVHRARKTMSKPGNGQVRLRGGLWGAELSLRWAFPSSRSGLLIGPQLCACAPGCSVSHSGLGLHAWTDRSPARFSLGQSRRDGC